MVDWGAVGAGAAQGAATGTAVSPGYGTAIGAVIGAAAAFFAGNSAEKAANKLTPQQKQLFDQIIKNTKSAGDFGQMVMSMARDPLIGGANFINSISTGDMDTINRLVGTDIRGLGESAQRSLRTMAQIAPRSGVVASTQADAAQQLRLQQQKVRTDAVNSGREAQVGLGMSEANLGLTGLGASTSGNQWGANFLQGIRQNAQAVGSNAASAAYTIAGNVLGSNNPNGTRNPGLTDWFTNYWKNKSSTPGAFFGGGDSGGASIPNTGSSPGAPVGGGLA